VVELLEQVISADADGSCNTAYAQSTHCTQWQRWTSSVFTRRQHLSILTVLCYTEWQLPAF